MQPFIAKVDGVVTVAPEPLNDHRRNAHVGEEPRALSFQSVRISSCVNQAAYSKAC